MQVHPMKSLITYIFLFLYLLVFHQLVSATPIAGDTSKINISTDTCICLQSAEDTLNVRVVSTPVQNSRSILDYLLPLVTVLISAFASSLIAFYSIKATFKKSLNLETVRQEELRKKELSEYCGTVYALHTIIQNCKRQAEQVKSVFESYKQVVMSKREFPFSDLGFRLRLDFLTNSTYEFLKYRQYESKIAAHLITYIHSAHNFNDFVDFQQIISGKAYFADESNYWKSVEEYFTNLLKRLDALSKELDTMTTTLEAELNKYPELTNVVK
jgi:hypothetical protein